MRVKWDAELGVEDDAEERAATGFTVWANEVAAVGEFGVVGEDGADSGEDGVAEVAEHLDLLACRGAGEPVRLVWITRGWRWFEFAVGRESGFERDEGCSVLDEVGEGVIELAGLLLQDAEGDFDVGVPESFNALTADFWIGVLSSDDAARYSGSDQCIRAGRGATVVTAGFEGDVRSGALSG